MESQQLTNWDLDAPELVWKEGGVPYSKEYRDIYYSTSDPKGERRHVFIDGIDAPHCWQAKSRFVVAETGFGTGLNFLLTWAEWRQSRSPGARLFYISVEGAPLVRADLERAHAQHPELNELSADLRSAYPDLHPGYHQLSLDGGKVELLLLWGPVEEMLCGLSASVDAWYLDGFAPSRNPAMWSPTVFSAIAQRSKSGTRLATYTSARSVHQGLEQVGFKCRKVTGFAGKRQSLTAITEIDGSVPRTAPWFCRSQPLKPAAEIAVIGAGISGACISSALQSAGADVIIVDSHPGPAGEASGNPAGLIQPRPGGGNPAYERLQTSAYFDALRTYDALNLNQEIWSGKRGVLSFGRTEDFLHRHLSWISSGGLPENHAQSIDPKETDAIAGVNIDLPAAWFPMAGTLNPHIICQSLIGHIKTLYGTRIVKIEPIGDRWALIGGNSRILLMVDAVVLANGYAASNLCPESKVPLYAKRGQISYRQATEQSLSLQVGLSYGGYATPMLDLKEGRAHILGATYQQWPDIQSNDWQALKQADHEENQSHVKARLASLNSMLSGPLVGGRASLRTTTTDHLPVVGPGFRETSYLRDFADLRHGKPPETYPDADYVPGVYMLSALGSRGFALAPLLAKVLCAEIMGTPSPVDETIHKLVHPARFLVRQLKRGYDVRNR